MRYIKRVLDISHDLERKSQFLFGPRQTGKTSWIREELDGVNYHFNLLDKKLVKALQDDPALFAGMLRREGIDSGLVVVDEIQKLPFLLDEVHNLIESTDIRFLLTGSSARRLREQGTNLLGGRAGWKEMYPLVWPEIKGDEPELDSLFRSGLIPAMYLSDDPDSDLFDYVQLYLNEEIQAEGLVRNLPSFERFLEVAALGNSEMLNYENISKDVGVSRSARCHPPSSRLREDRGWQYRIREVLRDVYGNGDEGIYRLQIKTKAQHHSTRLLEEPFRIRGRFHTHGEGCHKDENHTSPYGKGSQGAEGPEGRRTILPLHPRVQ